MSDYFRQNSFQRLFNKYNSWIILNDIEHKIKTKIETNGVPLKEWDIVIYRGILTGYNEAFIINEEKRNELVKKDPKSAEIIRPILRGRDIKRYSYEFADLYSITTFPSLKIDIDKYPAVKQHLDSYGRDRLMQTGLNGSRKKTSNKWFETQDTISYWEDFFRQKIVWLELTDKPNFCIDNDNYFLNNTVFFITGKNLEYLTAFLNSKVCTWYFTNLAATSGVGTTRWIKIYIEQIFVPKNIDSNAEKFLALKVNEIQDKKKLGINCDDVEIELENSIFDLFNFTEDERKFIELE